MKKEKYVKICSKCGSRNIEAISFYKGGRLRFFCKDCMYGYSKPGIIPEVKSSEISKFRKEIKERPKSNIKEVEETKTGLLNDMNKINAWILGITGFFCVAISIFLTKSIPLFIVGIVLTIFGGLVIFRK
tara:strand:- start:3135 stop:3524 length:390 start_codon:yes stop_codon:yes gene_type:complete